MGTEGKPSFPTPEYGIGDVVYQKMRPTPAVRRGVVSGIEVSVWSAGTIDKPPQHRIKYRLTVSDRPDGGFQHHEAWEQDLYASWDEAWWENRTRASI